MLDFTRLYKLRKDVCDAIVDEDVNKLNKILLNNYNSINLNYIDIEGQTPLHRGCTNGNLDIVKLLINYGADLNLTNRFGWYPIHIASYFGHVNIVLYLIEKSSNEYNSLSQNRTIQSSPSIETSDDMSLPSSPLSDASSTTPPASPPCFSSYD